MVVRRHRYIAFTKSNLKWVAYLNVKCHYIELQKDRIEQNLDDSEYSKAFLEITSKHNP